jgi:diguanylate cyclase (GGDEF)-like protein
MRGLPNILDGLRRLRTWTLAHKGAGKLRTPLLVTIGCIAVLVLIGRFGLTFVFLSETHRAAIRNAEADVERSARLAETIVNRHLLQVDSALASLPALLKAAAKSGDGSITSERASDLLLSLNFHAYAYRDLMLLTPNGEIWATARPRPRKKPIPIDMSTRSSLKQTTNVFGPFRNTATGEWSLYLAREVQVPGVGPMEAVAEVAVASIYRAMADIADKHGTRIFIERQGGRVVASIPHNEFLIGVPRLRSHPAANPDDVIEARRLTLYSDLAIVMQMDKSLALADWKRDRDNLLVLGMLAGVIVLLIAGGLAAALVHKSRQEAAQKASLAMLEEAVEAMSDGFVMWDQNDRLVACNTSYRKIYEKSAPFIKPGATFEEVVRSGALAGQYPQAGDDIEEFVRGVVEWHANTRGSYERLLPDGRWVLVTEQRTASGGVVGIRADVTKLKQALSELADANERVRDAMTKLQMQNDALRDRDLTLRTQYLLFDTALNNMSHGLLMADPEQRVVVCNSRFRDLFDIPSDARLNGLRLRDVFARHVRSHHEETCVAEIRDRQQELAQGKASGTFVIYMQNGQAIAITQRPTQDGGFVAIYEDVTEQKKAESRIRFLAHHDSLTNLPNRVMFRASLDTMAATLAPGRQEIAILYLDLDRFKDVNDTLGHQTGDALLEIVGLRLRQCLRDSDIVARLGGDEFAVAFVSSDAENGAALLAQRLIDELSKPYAISDHVVSVGVSVGIATVGHGEMDVDTILKCADMALYGAKGKGRGRYCIFEPHMEAELKSRLRSEQDLKAALAQQEFRLVYQPLVDLASERVIGYEALLRWESATRGTVSPAEFIPLAEELNMIGAIGAWCLDEACRTMVALPTDGKLAVNLSPVQLRSDEIVDVVRAALTASGLDPARLELEITESALLEGSEQIIARLHRLHALGVRIVLDDFGTGFSSLNYLRSFPFDKIKIDKVFVGEANSRPDCEAIVQSVVELASRLGMTTTAEGIETKEQLELVRRLGCDEGQGYLFGRPQPILSIVASLEGRGHEVHAEAMKAIAV